MSQLKSMTYDLEMLQLLTQGFISNQHPRTSQSRYVPLHKLLVACLCGDLAEVRRLSYDPSVEIEAFYPFLHAAIKGGHSEVVEFLLKEGANKNTKFDGRSPLHLAFHKNQFKIFILLLDSGADLSLLYEEFPQVLYVAAFKGQLNFLELLLKKEGGVNARSSNHDTSLLLIYVGNNLEVAEFLVQKGADVNVRNKYQSTALHAACHFNGSNSPAIVQFLVRSRAAVDVEDIFGATPLHVASAKGNLAIMRSLVGAGAEINALDKRNRSPLHYAVYEGRALEVIQFLVKAGVDVRAKEEGNGFTALDIVMTKTGRSNEQIVKYLLSLSPSPSKSESLRSFSMKNNSKEIPQDLTSVGDFKKDSPLGIILQEHSNSLILHFCALNGRLSVLRRLLSFDAFKIADGHLIHSAIRGKDVDILSEVLEAIWKSCGKNRSNFAAEVNRREDSTEETPLMTAVRCGRLELVKLLAEEEAVDLNLQNKDGLTALHIAAEENLIEIAKLLVWNVDATLKDKKGRTALDIASEDFL